MMVIYLITSLYDQFLKHNINRRGATYFTSIFIIIIIIMVNNMYRMNKFVFSLPVHTNTTVVSTLVDEPLQFLWSDGLLVSHAPHQKLLH